MTERWLRVPTLTAVAIGCLLAQRVSHGQVATTRALPTVIEATVPTYPRIAILGRISGSVELNVVTDGERVAKVNIVKLNPIFEREAQRAVATWIFAPHQPTSFWTTIDFELSEWEFIDPASCVTREVRRVVTHDLPTRVHVVGTPDSTCNAGEPVKGTITASALAGQVVCDCPGRSPVSGAYVSYSRRPTSAEARRGVSIFQGHTEVDASGRFQIDGAPAGTYSVGVGGVTFNSRGYEVEVVLDGKTRQPLSLPIVPNAAVAEYLRLHPRELGWVATEQIPTYPIEALKAGVEGSVVIRITPGTPPVVLDEGRLLGAAALDFAKTWKTSSDKNQPFDVRLTYRLTEGDCAGGGQLVVLDLPRQIEITAKRIIPCGLR